MFINLFKLLYRIWFERNRPGTHIRAWLQIKCSAVTKRIKTKLSSCICLHSSQKQNSATVFVYIPPKNKTLQLYLFTFLSKLSNCICLHSSQKQNSAAVFVYIPPKLRNCICLHSSLNSAAVFVNISPKKQNSAAIFVYIPPKNKTQQMYLISFLPKTKLSSCIFFYIPPKNQQLYLFTFLPKNREILSLPQTLVF